MTDCNWTHAGMITSIVPVYVSECSSAKRRGRSVAMQLSIVIVSFCIRKYSKEKQRNGARELIVGTVWHRVGLLAGLWNHQKLNRRGKIEFMVQSSRAYFNLVAGSLEISNCFPERSGHDHACDSSVSPRNTQVSQHPLLIPATCTLARTVRTRTLTISLPTDGFSHMTVGQMPPTFWLDYTAVHPTTRL